MLELDYSNNSFNKVLFCLLGVTTSALDAILVLSLVKLSKSIKILSKFMEYIINIYDIK